MATNKFEEDNEPWDLILEPRTKWYSLGLSNILRFKDLLFLFVKRDFVSVYKKAYFEPYLKNP